MGARDHASHAAAVVVVIDGTVVVVVDVGEVLEEVVVGVAACPEHAVAAISTASSARSTKRPRILSLPLLAAPS
ncbi:MAG: hypothetical protein A2V75_05530 [Actinobacteria bacterium RBG_16_70_17]|nr:MAG: hypothetical protein A2V75_05530 [Actinobacteria bacterium RBG_16_70_17]